jgi:hypothetical protein
MAGNEKDSLVDAVAATAIIAITVAFVCLWLANMPA